MVREYYDRSFKKNWNYIINFFNNANIYKNNYYGSKHPEKKNQKK